MTLLDRVHSLFEEGMAANEVGLCDVGQQHPIPI
jgi:hypothetical protein